MTEHTYNLITDLIDKSDRAWERNVKLEAENKELKRPANQAEALMDLCENREKMGLNCIDCIFNESRDGDCGCSIGVPKRWKL